MCRLFSRSILLYFLKEVGLLKLNPTQEFDGLGKTLHGQFAGMTSDEELWNILKGIQD